MARAKANGKTRKTSKPGRTAAAGVTSFRRRVFTIVRAIPAGRVATYGDVARLAGAPRAARAVGNVMRTCDDPSIPCHRVTGANGALGGYGSSPLLKRQLLIAEGITLRGGRLREFAKIRWNGRR
jgi:O-6-methylguanine DNA methyltransferase